MWMCINQSHLWFPQRLNLRMAIISLHYTAAHISMEAAAERKSPAVLEIYPLERQRLNAVKQRWRSILSEETWWLSKNKDPD